MSKKIQNLYIEYREKVLLYHKVNLKQKLSNNNYEQNNTKKNRKNNHLNFIFSDTALIYACEKGHGNLAKWLVQNGAQINEKNYSG